VDLSIVGGHSISSLKQYYSPRFETFVSGIKIHVYLHPCVEKLARSYINFYFINKNKKKYLFKRSTIGYRRFGPCKRFGRRFKFE